MSKIDKLIASVNKAEEKVEKTGKTIERHFKQLDKKMAALNKMGYNMDYSGIDFHASYIDFKKEVKPFEDLKVTDGETSKAYPELCDICWKLEDIRGAYKKQTEAKTILANWKVKVVAEKAKVDFAASAPKVIVDFVNAWGEMAFQWHMHNTKKPNETSIRSAIENDKQIKIIQLTMRVTEVVGTITDAKGLSVGEKGDLIGVIIGEEGKAQVETITAGGWNIQCFHYRTIVNKI